MQFTFRIVSNVLLTTVRHSVHANMQVFFSGGLPIIDRSPPEYIDDTIFLKVRVQSFLICQSFLEARVQFFCHNTRYFGGDFF